MSESEENEKLFFVDSNKDKCKNKCKKKNHLISFLKVLKDEYSCKLYLLGIIENKREIIEKIKILEVNENFILISKKSLC